MKNNYLKQIILIIILLTTKISFSQCYSDSATTYKNTSIVINVRANDFVIFDCFYTTDYSICCGSEYGPQNGTITILHWDSIRYTPNTDFVGNDNFYYSTFNDTLPNGTCDTGKVYVTVLNTTNIENYSKTKNDFVIFPNPTKNSVIYLKEIKADNKEFEIRIFNILGEIIINKTFNKTYNNSVELDITGFNSGIYLVEVKTEKEQTIQKLIIE